MKITATVSILLAIAASPVFADCTPPSDSLVIPNGSQATRDEMIAAQKAVKDLNTAVSAYGDCLKQEEDAKVAAGGDKVKLHNTYAKLNNDQVARLQQVAAKFNEELHAFMAKNAKPATQ
jgi:hypothetical protein